MRTSWLCSALISLLGSTPAVAEPEIPFDHSTFCAAVQDIERRHNEKRGGQIDELTRHDGMSVDCDRRVVELKLHLLVGFNGIAGNWQDRANFKWSEDYCGDGAWAAAITHGWRVLLTVSSVVGEDVSLRADCH